MNNGEFPSYDSIETRKQKEPASHSGTKYDSGKPQLSIIPPAAMEAIAKVFMFGAKKYTRDNFRGGFARTRLLDATLRHIYADLDGEDLDPESGLPHLWHAACSLCMLITNISEGRSEDDRYKK